MSGEKVTRSMRVAIRREGAFINAYWAKLETMEDAILLGTMRETLMRLPGMFEEFQQFMAKAATALIEDVGGLEVKSVEIYDAPEHEKAGHA